MDAERSFEAFVGQAMADPDVLGLVLTGSASGLAGLRAEAVRHGLDAAFALEGRVRPYPDWLAHELRAEPLSSFPVAGDDLLRLLAAVVEGGDAAALRRLLAAVVAQARAAGHGDVVDSWGDAVPWMLGKRADAPP